MRDRRSDFYAQKSSQTYQESENARDARSPYECTRSVVWCSREIGWSKQLDDLWAFSTEENTRQQQNSTYEISIPRNFYSVRNNLDAALNEDGLKGS